MKKIFTMCCAAAAMLAGIVSCEEPETGYTGINYIYLESDANSIYDMEEASLEITVRLTTVLNEDLILTFDVPDDSDNIIVLDGNPVTIPAGSTTATLVVKPMPLSTESATFTVTLDDSTILPENVSWSGDFKFTVMSSAMEELTAEEQAIISAYLDKTGIDLAKYIGLVNVTTVYTAPTEDGYPMQDETIRGITAIKLSEESTAEQPVLKMTRNPMGIQDKMLEKLKASTVGYYIWTDENAYDSYPTLMEEVPWTNNETFSMSLDGIKPKTGGTVDFTAEVTEIRYDEEVTVLKVPFDFEFSLYEKEKQALADGKIGTAVDEYWAEDATYNPYFQLNYEDISESYAIDEYEGANWIKADATISNEKLVFTFSMFNYIDYGYTKVVATYTPNE